MAYRSTKEKAENRTLARQMYVQGGLSLEEISQSTGETVKTLRAWRKLGQWDLLKDGVSDPEHARLRHLRNSLLDRIEAQLKDDKLPHTEIGLLAKVDRMLARYEEKTKTHPARTVLATLELLTEDLQEHDLALLRKLGPHIKRIGDRAAAGGLAEILR